MFAKLKNIRVKLPKRLQLGLNLEQREEGVTLIELLAVVVILGIISAVAVPVVSGAINNAKVNATLNSEGTIQVALQRYYDQMGYYPLNLSTLAGAYSTTTGTTTGSGPTAGPYLSNQFPELDGFGHRIYYLPVKGASGTHAPGYILVSGDGTSLTGATLTLASNTPYIYAAGGNNGGTSLLGSPPTQTNGFPTSGSSSAANVYTTGKAATTVSTGTTNTLGEWTDQ